LNIVTNNQSLYRYAIAVCQLHILRNYHTEFVLEYFAAPSFFLPQG